MIECFKQRLMGHPCSRLKDRSAESYVNYCSPAQEVSEGNNISNSTRDPYNILAKNVAAFFLCPKNLPKAKFKSNRLISLVEYISRSILMLTLPRSY